MHAQTLRSTHGYPLEPVHSCSESGSTYVWHLFSPHLHVNIKTHGCAGRQAVRQTGRHCLWQEEDSLSICPSLNPPLCCKATQAWIIWQLINTHVSLTLKSHRLCIYFYFYFFLRFPLEKSSTHGASIISEGKTSLRLCGENCGIW